MHGVRKIRELCAEDHGMAEDVQLLRAPWRLDSGRISIDIRRAGLRAGSRCAGMREDRGLVMKFSIERADLVKAVAQAQSVVERRHTIPILANVQIEATPDGVGFRATDLDTEVVDRANAHVERPGATTVSAADAERNRPQAARWVAGDHRGGRCE